MPKFRLKVLKIKKVKYCKRKLDNTTINIFVAEVQIINSDSKVSILTTGI